MFTAANNESGTMLSSDRGILKKKGNSMKLVSQPLSSQDEFRQSEPADEYWYDDRNDEWYPSQSSSSQQDEPYPGDKKLTRQSGRRPAKQSNKFMVVKRDRIETVNGSRM